MSNTFIASGLDFRLIIILSVFLESLDNSAFDRIVVSDPWQLFLRVVFFHDDDYGPNPISITPISPLCGSITLLSMIL